jgi:aspartate carbamoyltransferase
MNVEEGSFVGRSLNVVNDLSVDEQIYLYDKTCELKRRLSTGVDPSDFLLNDPNLGVYLIFLEDSTRTKESFRNAAKFHNVKVNDFNVQGSSFNKKESITDTVKMLFGYSARSMFVIRSRLEGTCSWLEDALGGYAQRIGRPAPSFINAGDGKHEHPTQEFLDEFTFLEHVNWDRSAIHLALVGDLCHGRTVHSKVDGLRVFGRVMVDLIAPKELELPDYYEARMAANNYTVRKFGSIEEYLSQPEVAEIWYFTRLQLERMGEEVLEKAPMLRRAVTFRREFLPQLRGSTRFYHPLPRHSEFPTIPFFLDHLPVNGWDLQSTNGYYTRIVEIAMLAGKIGKDFAGAGLRRPVYVDDFVEEVPVRQAKLHDYKVGIKPVENGIVIDHIGRGSDLTGIWDHIDKIRRIMRLNYRSSHGVYHSSSDSIFKGIVSLPDVLSFDETQIKMLAAIAPGCTLNMVEGGKVRKKYRLHMPPRIYNFDEISCKNENCISNPKHFEQVRQEFYKSEDSTFVCRYCEKPHNFSEIWDV